MLNNYILLDEQVRSLFFPRIFFYFFVFFLKCTNDFCWSTMMSLSLNAQCTNIQPQNRFDKCIKTGYVCYTILHYAQKQTILRQSVQKVHCSSLSLHPTTMQIIANNIILSYFVSLHLKFSTHKYLEVLLYHILDKSFILNLQIFLIKSVSREILGGFFVFCIGAKALFISFIWFGVTRNQAI